MSGPLTNPKYERVAQGLAKGMAADAAYAAAGYKPNRGNASRLANRPDVQARVASILSAAAERVEITQARVLEELAKIGFSDIRKLFTAGGNLIPVHDLEDAAAACISSIDVVTRKAPGGEEAEVEHVAKIKVWDKRAALVDIGKHLGMFKDKVEVTGKDGGPVEMEMSDREIARRIAFALTKGAAQKPAVQ